jgi:phenylacetic acid degradation protein
MSIYKFENRKPKIGKGTFIFDSADIIGDVILGKNCYVGPGARIRGDYGSIIIGDNTAVEENVVIHARPNDKTKIGDYVTIGHAAIIHNAVIHDWSVIGMGAIVSDWADIGRWAVVAEGALVKNKQKVPDNTIVIGVPSKIISEVSKDYKKQWTKYKKIYSDLSRNRFPLYLKKCEISEMQQK